MYCLEKKKECCICQESSNVVVSCKYCVDGIVCGECYSKLKTFNTHEKCPCCRQEEWNESVSIKTKIYPVSTRNNEFSDLESGVIVRREKSCREKVCSRLKCALRSTIYIIRAFWTVTMLWMLGCLTLFVLGVLGSDYPEDGLMITLVPILVGAAEIIFITCCCCSTECKDGMLSAWFNIR